MKIYSNTLTSGDLNAAISAANQHTQRDPDNPFHGSIGFERCRSLARPRVRARGWDVLLHRTGSTMHFNTGMHGAGEDGAASWDDWGWFLAALYEQDPGMRAAYYTSAEDFHRSTGNAFRPGGSPRLRPEQARDRLGAMGYSQKEARQILATARRRYTPGYRVRSGAGTAYTVAFRSQRYQITEQG